MITPEVVRNLERDVIKYKSLSNSYRNSYEATKFLLEEAKAEIEYLRMSMKIVPNAPVFDIENTANLIRIHRQKKGLSQQAVAAKLNISQNAYSRMERGFTKITIDRISEIAKVFGIKYQELL